MAIVAKITFAFAQIKCTLKIAIVQLSRVQAKRKLMFKEDG